MAHLVLNFQKLNILGHDMGMPSARCWWRRPGKTRKLRKWNQHCNRWRKFLVAVMEHLTSLNIVAPHVIPGPRFSASWTKSFDLPFCRPPSCLFWNCKATCEGHWLGWCFVSHGMLCHCPSWTPMMSSHMRLLLRNMADMVSACQGKASQHIETHAFSLSFNISVKPTGEYACFPSRIDLEGTLAHVALKTQLAFGICLRQVSNAKRSRREKRLIGAWDKHMLETKAMPTLERTNPVENPPKNQIFLTCYIEASDVERYTRRFEVHIWVWSWCIVIALQTICIVWCCFILPHLHYHARLAIDR